MSTIVLINSFEVPEGKQEEFLHGFLARENGDGVYRIFGTASS